MNKAVLIPVTPAHEGSRVAIEGQALQDPNFCMAVIAIMMKRQGIMEVAFSQADFDEIAGLVLLEGRNEKNEFLLGLGYKTGVRTS